MFNTLPRKILIPLLVLAATGQARPAIGQQPPVTTPPPSPLDNIHGSVTLPYAELRALWQAATPAAATPPEKPPVPYTVRSARYTLEFSADGQEGTVEASYDIQTFNDGWSAVPLLGSANARLQQVEPDGVLIAVRDGFYTLVTDKRSTQPVKLRFSVPLAPHDEPGGKRRLDLRLETGPALINELAVSKIPAGWLVQVANAAAASQPPSPAEEGTRRYHLAGSGGVALTLARAADQPSAPVPSTWRGEAQSVVRYDDGRLAYKTHLRITTEAGAGLRAALTLPLSVNVQTVTGDDLGEWHVVRVDGPGGTPATRRLDLVWKTGDVLRRELVLSYERPQLLVAGDWPLVSPALAEGQGRLESAFYILPMMDGLEFAAGEATPALNPGDRRQIPRWVAAEAGGGSFVTCTVANAAPARNETALVRARQLPLVQTVKATVEESRFETRLVADGALLTKGVWSVRHDAPLTFALTLPAGAQVLTCLANGHDIAAIDRGTGLIEIPLPGSPGDKPTTVALSYTAKQPPLAPVSGQMKLILPQTPLFVKTLDWDLQIPDAYELIALEGNVTQTPPGDSNRPGIHLGKDLLNGEQPSVELFYQKRSVNP